MGWWCPDFPDSFGSPDLPITGSPDVQCADMLMGVLRSLTGTFWWVFASGAANGRVLGADSLADIGLHFALEVAQHITAEDIDVVTPGCLVPEVFNLNRRIRFALRPQQRRAFTTGSNSIPRFGRCCEQIVCHFLKAGWIGQIVHDKGRDNLFSVNGAIDSAFHGGHSIHAARLQ